MNEASLVNPSSASSGFHDIRQLEDIRLVSHSRIISRGSSGRVELESLRRKYSQLSNDDLLELLVATDEQRANLEDENYAFIEQILQMRKDFDAVQAELVALKSTHGSDLAAWNSEREALKTIAEKRESEIIFLEDHARFSSEQTKLSILHWDLLLKNRDENIELLTSRVTQLTNDSRLSAETGVTSDNFKCLLERFENLKARFKAVSKEEVSEGEEGVPAQCPWRHQADVRVSQLERVTAQLNSTYEQLHSKSDELLLQNRELGSLRRKAFENDAKIKRYKVKIRVLKEKAPGKYIPSPETSSIHSNE